MSVRPLGRKAYGSIGHLPGSNTGPTDSTVPEGQSKICQKKARPGDEIIIMEKLDGTCVSVANIDGCIVPLVRAGYIADTSPHYVHHLFFDWVGKHAELFKDLPDRWRIVGEWMPMTHGTLYAWQGSPWVCFDVFNERNERLVWSEAKQWIERCGQRPASTIENDGQPMTATKAYLCRLPTGGFYNAIAKPEGVVYRVEREGKVDFMAKWVHRSFVPGRYLSSVTGGAPIWQCDPSVLGASGKYLAIKEAA
tara:strand:- start:878 stop:1630 length:753 start_codon:yes stop_codon:yes gene_type:complete